MRRWETPRAEVEEFMPNEYCSSCWGVACDIKKANKYDKKTLGSNSHRSEHCGNPGNQVVRDLDENGTADIMLEVGTDGLDTLTCTLYTNESYREKADISSVGPGSYIYWTTSAKDGRTWHHQGEVQATYPGQPNRS